VRRAGGRRRGAPGGKTNGEGPRAYGNVQRWGRHTGTGSVPLGKQRSGTRRRHMSGRGRGPYTQNKRWGVGGVGKNQAVETGKKKSRRKRTVASNNKVHRAARGRRKRGRASCKTGGEGKGGHKSRGGSGRRGNKRKGKKKRDNGAYTQLGGQETRPLQQCFFPES